MGDCALTGDQLNEFIDFNDGDIQKATTAAWSYLAAERVSMVNVSEAGSSRSLGDVFTNTLKMAQFHAAQVAAENQVPVVRRTTIRHIERP